MDIIGELIDAHAVSGDDDGHQRQQELGLIIGKLYTDHGLPIDMAFDRLPDISKDDKVVILTSAHSWLIDHKRNSGASEKAIERQRKSNLDSMERFLKTGEVGIY